MRKIFTTIIFICYCAITDVFAVEILRMRFLSEKDGLSQNTVFHILQDKQGFMWMAASNGINRYDGREFITIWPKTTGSRLAQVAQDEEGIIWIKTGAGDLKYYDSRKESFEDAVSEGSGVIFDRRLEYAGSDAVTTEGKIIPDAKYIIDNKGNRWGYNMSGTLWRQATDGTFQPFLLMPPEILSLVSAERYNIYHDSRDIIWVSTFGNGLFAIDPETGHLDHFTTEDGLPTNYLYCVTEDNSGEIWVGTDYSGVVKISVSDYYPVDTFYPAGKGSNDRSNAVRIIYADSGNRYWFGTRDGELFVCDSLLQPVSRHRIASGMPYAIAEDSLGNKWVGTKTGKGVTIFPADGDSPPRVINISDHNSPASTIDVFSILRDSEGRMWVASFGKGLFLGETHEKNIGFRRFPMESPELNKMRGMIQTSDGLIWAGSDGGVIVFDPDEVESGNKRFINLRFDPENDSSLSHNEVKAIFEDSRKRIWLGTAGGGLNLLIKKNPLETSAFKRYGSGNGMFNETAQAIEEDGNGFLWISTENGISRFDPRTERFDNFFFSENPMSNVFNERSSWKTGNGKLMFGSYNGVSVFDPIEISYDKYAPPVIITGLQVNGHETSPGMNDSPLKESIATVDRIELKHNVNSFSLGFSMLNYAAPELNQYSYILEGYDDAWSPVSHDNIASYISIPSGTYVFRVKGSNSLGVWSDSETVLEIRVLPPWWASWWAITLYFLIALFAAAILLSMKKQAEQRRRIRGRFPQEPGIARPATVSSDKDREFLDKIHGEIGLNIDNPELAVDDLIKVSGMSRTIFYQNVKRLTGYAPKEYLRVIRLKKAAELLRDTDYRVSDIAYKVGFDDPLYFSRCFKTQFGKSPSEYKSSVNKQNI